jgi:hypothetical protein
MRLTHSGYEQLSTRSYPIQLNSVAHATTSSTTVFSYYSMQFWKHNELELHPF